MKRIEGARITTIALLAALFTVCALSPAACSRTSCRVQGKGTMKYLSMEGGFYGIDADSGAHYRPVNLPKGFAQDGLRVRFCAEPLEGVMSFHMWGTPVEIVKMEPLNPKGNGIEPAGERKTTEPRNH